jgi:hypothetical protein
MRVYIIFLKEGDYFIVSSKKRKCISTTISTFSKMLVGKVKKVISYYVFLGEHYGSRKLNHILLYEGFRVQTYIRVYSFFCGGIGLGKDVGVNKRRSKLFECLLYLFCPSNGVM